MAATKFHFGFVGPCRDGVMGEVIAIEPRASTYAQLVYLRGSAIVTTSLEGQWGPQHKSPLDLLPPAPKMVTRWVGVAPATGYATKELAEAVFGHDPRFTVVPVEVEVP